MVSVETMRCHKVGRIVRYPMPNKLLPPKKLVHCVLLIFYPFRDKKRSVIKFSTNISKQTLRTIVQDAVNKNKIKVEAMGI